LKTVDFKNSERMTQINDAKWDVFTKGIGNGLLDGVGKRMFILLLCLVAISQDIISQNVTNKLG